MILKYRLYLPFGRGGGSGGPILNHLILRMLRANLSKSNLLVAFIEGGGGGGGRGGPEKWYNHRRNANHYRFIHTWNSCHCIPISFMIL